MRALCERGKRSRVSKGGKSERGCARVGCVKRWRRKRFRVSGGSGRGDCGDGAPVVSVLEEVVAVEVGMESIGVGECAVNRVIIFAFAIRCWSR